MRYCRTGGIQAQNTSKVSSTGPSQPPENYNRMYCSCLLIHQLPVHDVLQSYFTYLSAPARLNVFNTASSALMLVFWSKSYENSNKQISVRPRLSRLQCLARDSFICRLLRRSNKWRLHPNHVATTIAANGPFTLRTRSIYLSKMPLGRVICSFHSPPSTDTSSVGQIKAVPFASTVSLASSF